MLTIPLQWLIKKYGMTVLILIIIGLVIALIYLAISIVRLIIALIVASADATSSGEWWGPVVLFGLIGGIIYLMGLIFWWW